ncbi:hypothetical protein EVAR_72873_1 [Eumeta japonica]|uniref:Uncharacterized protein n=1 Tax=Eumeta variegata TaxID=151549 RepID=A0A4C2AE90_EUMVA|nr:hypothetical protein EVAR_72873_1 [Eumeta japonica]
MARHGSNNIAHDTLKAHRTFLFETVTKKIVTGAHVFHLEELEISSGLGKDKGVIVPSHNTFKDSCVGHYRHCTLGSHARRLGLPYSDFCRSCLLEEKKIVLHLLGTCRALDDFHFRRLILHCDAK